MMNPATNRRSVSLFSLLPWRMSHWVLLLVGPLFVVAYVSLLSWGPVDAGIQRLSPESGYRDAAHGMGLPAAEAILGIVSLLLMTPLVGMVALFLLLFAMVTLEVALGPLVRGLGLPDWAFMVLLGATVSSVIYAKSAAWLPWSLWFIDRAAAAYLIPFL